VGRRVGAASARSDRPIGRGYRAGRIVEELLSVGLVRLFLAWVVAADHWRVLVLSALSIEVDDRVKFGFNSGYAVLFFYVISGFLITYALSQKYGDDTRGFYKSRFIRIFSLYWPVVVVVLLVLEESRATFMAGTLWDKLTGVFLLGADWNIAFATYPTPNFGATIRFLEQAWTLGAELTFYLMAPLLMRSWKFGAVLLVASLGVRWLFAGNDPNGTWSYYFIGSTICFFMLGHLICLAARRWRVLAYPRLGLPLMVCSFMVMTFGSYAGGFDTARLWVSILLFTIALPGLFEATKNLRWMNIAGDLSYPIYLIHLVLLVLIGKWLVGVVLSIPSLTAAGIGYGSMMTFLLAATGGAALVHRLLEVPVAQAMRYVAGHRPFRRRAPAAAP
jgi:peptidoglycan/LPS O-acetylase OafA/YrhL